MQKLSIDNFIGCGGRLPVEMGLWNPNLSAELNFRSHLIVLERWRQKKNGGEEIKVNEFVLVKYEKSRGLSQSILCRQGGWNRPEAPQSEIFTSSWCIIHFCLPVGWWYTYIDIVDVSSVEGQLTAIDKAGTSRTSRLIIGFVENISYYSSSLR